MTGGRYQHQAGLTQRSSRGLQYQEGWSVWGVVIKFLGVTENLTEMILDVWEYKTKPSRGGQMLWSPSLSLRAPVWLVLEFRISQLNWMTNVFFFSPKYFYTFYMWAWRSCTINILILKYSVNKVQSDQNWFKLKYIYIKACQGTNL